MRKYVLHCSAVHFLGLKVVKSQMASQTTSGKILCSATYWRTLKTLKSMDSLRRAKAATGSFS